MPNSAVPIQQNVDWSDPEQHVSWALRGLPLIAGTGGLTNPHILLRWSKHLVEAGFAHVDYLRTLADEDGNINVSQLPEQTIKFQQAFRGPRHHYNPAAQWVAMDTPDVETVVIPDPAQFTIQENQAIVARLEEIGAIKTPKPPQHKAQALNEGH